MESDFVDTGTMSSPNGSAPQRHGPRGEMVTHLRCRNVAGHVRCRRKLGVPAERFKYPPSDDKQRERQIGG